MEPVLHNMGAPQQVLSSLGGGAAAPASFSDDFENGTTINAAWQNGPGVMPVFTQGSGVATGSGGAAGGMVTIGAGRTFSGDHQATLTVALGGLSGGGPAVRMQWTSGNDTSNCYYAYITNSTFGVWKMYNDSFSFAQIGSDIAITQTTGDTFTLQASGTGTVTFTCYKNGGSIGTVSDDGTGAGGAAYSGGQPGMLLNSGTFTAAFSAQEP